MKVRLEQVPGSDLPRAARRAVRPQLEWLGFVISADAMRTAPVDELGPHPGHLRDSGYWDLRSDGILEVGFSADYAGYVAEGHRTRDHKKWVRGNPWFKNALYKRRTFRRF